jgi:putative endonuclease
VTAHRDNAALGAHGESLAAQWYEANGYTVVDRNWRPDKRGELDLVLCSPDGRVTVVCEVKTRSSDRFGSPIEAITEAKALRLRRLAMEWLATHPSAPRALRVDVASVLRGDVEIFEGII